MTANLETTSLDQHNQILEDAWKRFDIYDRNATAAQKRFVSLRKWILILGVLSTFLAVLSSVLDGTLKTCTPGNQQVICNPPWFNSLQTLNAFLYFPVVLTPIIVSILLAGAVKFDRGVNWVLLRASAEAIKREIYRYRSQVGIYKRSHQVKLAGEAQVEFDGSSEVMLDDAADINNEPSEVKLAREVKIVGERLMKTQVNQASLEIPEEDNVKDNLPARDDRFSPLDAQKYLKWRLIDQLSWYRKKTRAIDRRLQRLQCSIFILGGVGTFLAAIKLEVWIAVSNAIAGALISFLEFRQWETTLIAYNQAANNLENILYWWHALSSEAKTQPQNFEKLVANTEAVIQKETTGWVQEMRDALAELYSEKTAEKGQVNATKMAQVDDTAKGS